MQLLMKRFELLPTPAGLDWAQQRWAATPAVHSVVRQLRAVADEFDDRVLIGELWMPARRLVRFYGRGLTGLQLPFNFQMISLPWTAAAIHRAVAGYEGLLPSGAWPNWVLGNHDRKRIASRVGPAQARVAAVLLLTLRGTPTMYYGDELGMTDVPIAVEERRDPQGLNGGDNRDSQRTPMRWDASTTAGFTVGRPWLPIGPDVATVNVATERADDESMLTLYRRLLDLRRAERALSVGDWQDLGRKGGALAYLRTDGNRRFLVAANLTSSPTALPQAAVELSGQIALSARNPGIRGSFSGHASLAPDDAVVVLLD
jgi:alpha-glucosidase